MKNSKKTFAQASASLTKMQLIAKLTQKNIKGGYKNCPPPFGNNKA